MKKLLFILLPLLAFTAIADTNVIPAGSPDGSFYNFNVNGETISISATTSTANAAFTLTNSINAPDVTITNAGTSTVFVNCGIGNATAATLPNSGVGGNFPVLAGEILTLRKAVGSNYCAAITATATATVYFTAGFGQ